MNNPFLEAAAFFHQQQWAIIPLHTPVFGKCSCGNSECGSPGKHPRTKTGLKEASNDWRVIEQWAHLWPTANIGVVTGEVSGIFVLDIDDMTALELVERGLDGPLPDTLTAITSRGLHYYFKMAPGIKNRASLWPHVDVRGEGGYVVAPPSLHPSGVYYDWRESSSPEIAEAPAALLAAIRGAEKKAPVISSSPSPQRTNGASGLSNYQQAAMDKAFENVRSAPEGQRNHILNKEAYSLAGLDIPISQIRNELTYAAQQAGLSQREIEKTIESGLSNGVARPRQIEPTPSPQKREVKPKEVKPVDPDIELYNLTDTGNAERFAKRHRENVRHVTEWGGWYIWDGKRWGQDRTAEIGRLAKDTVRSIAEETASLTSDMTQKKIMSWAHKSESAERRNALVKLAAIEPGLQIVPELLDMDQWAFTCSNGTIDLRTGQLRPHRREDLSTKMSQVAFDPDAKCTKWLTFLRQVLRSEDLVSYVQRAVGYALTGDTREQCIFFLHGTGRNGKSTFLEVLLSLFADFAQKAEMQTFMAQRNEGGPRNDIAALRAARFVAASESDSGARLNEALLKELTGGEPMRARFLFKESFEFKPQFKLFLAANYKPQIRGTDEGIWRRIMMLPFTVTIPLTDIDKELPAKLRAELPGILAWAVEGCLLWQKVGLVPPKEVTLATEEYRDEQDVLAEFVAAKCILDPKAKIASRELYRAYKSWADGEQTEAISEKAFSVQLSGKGYPKKRWGKHMLWHGIGVQGVPSQVDLPV